MGDNKKVETKREKDDIAQPQLSQNEDKVEEVKKKQEEIPGKKMDDMYKRTQKSSTKAKRKSNSNSINLKSGNRKSVSTETAEKPKTIEVNAGYQLEYRIKRLAFFMGYFPRVGVELRTAYDNESDVITDLDVYGTYVHKDFTRKTLWADCKSGKVEVHKRLSWIKGILTEAEISNVIFVAPRVRTAVKEFARKSDIQILDLSLISKLENQFGIKDKDWRGSWNPKTQFNKINKLTQIKAPQEEANRKIAKFISSDYWVNDNYSKVKKSITALRDLSLLCELALGEEEKATVKWAVFELVSLFTLAVFDIAREIYYFHDTEKRDTIHAGLTSSDMSNKRRSEVFDTAVRVAYSFVKGQYPDLILPDKFPNFNLTPPGYFESFYDLLLRITNNPLGYYDVLRFFDFVLMEYDLQGKIIDEKELRSLFNNYDDVIMGAQTILHFLCRVTNLPQSLFQLIK
ncbi:hypothetical protein [Paenibacillus sp. A3M_27_13]|uniref:hypothetical protein n=1 Tax=Paenibacillus sp. A3M_27_13 TaxID=2962029 RepID=UPI0020B82606|nr:hypothetical protein [Paenibacillus sp. A3M_27_13]MCP3746730.1 hypothetical protein [Paenibacillus sp. A3M_27_13]